MCHVARNELPKLSEHVMLISFPKTCLNNEQLEEEIRCLDEAARDSDSGFMDRYRLLTRYMTSANQVHFHSILIFERTKETIFIMLHVKSEIRISHPKFVPSAKPIFYHSHRRDSWH